MKILEGLKPEKVFHYFEEISAIPRGSRNTERIRDYCVSFAKERNLKYIADKSGNVVIYKQACNSKSDEPVIIQGHLDMVWEKNEDCRIDFETDGLELEVDGDFVKARGTTLGGDDGIAVAMCLALLDSSDIVHPPLEIVLTADEEVGMSGAEGLDTSVLDGKRMINLDSEAEGTLWVSCAGGVRADIKLKPEYVNNVSPVYEITVSGLHGGHSGAEIHKGYLNANKVMGTVLSELKNEADFRISDINGGTMDNAITRDCVCLIASGSDCISDKIDGIYKKLCENSRDIEPDLKVSVSVGKFKDVSMSAESTNVVIELLNELPSGVVAMSREIDGLVETSLNLGVLKHNGEAVDFCFSVRSGIDGERNKLSQRLVQISEKYSCNISFHGEYPAWEYKKESPLREMMSDIYRKMFGKDMIVTAIHAGLECGLFCGKIEGLDCVSLGPDMFDIHTPLERLSISSTERVWNYLLKVLESL